MRTKRKRKRQMKSGWSASYHRDTAVVGRSVDNNFYCKMLALHFNILIASLLFFNCFLPFRISGFFFFAFLFRDWCVSSTSTNAQKVPGRTLRSLKIIYLCFVHGKDLLGKRHAEHIWTSHNRIAEEVKSGHVLRSTYKRMRMAAIQSLADEPCSLASRPFAFESYHFELIESRRVATDWHANYLRIDQYCCFAHTFATARMVHGVRQH